MLSFISYHPLVHIRLGPLSISPHGIGIALGFLLGARLLLPETTKQGISEDSVYSLLTRAAIGSIIGARVAYVINHVGDYSSPLEALKVWKGGISLLGGFAGAILIVLPEMRRRGMSFWKVMDAAAPGMALGVFVGRIGDLIVWDHLGKPTSFFLGYRCPPPDVATAVPCVGRVVHEPALYDLVMVGLLLVVLLRLRRTRRYDGFLIGFFGLWYGVERLIEDFFRIDVTHGLGLTGSQWTAVVLIVVCLWFLVRVRHTPRWGRWDEPGAAEGKEPDEDALVGAERTTDERTTDERVPADRSTDAGSPPPSTSGAPDPSTDDAGVLTGVAPADGGGPAPSMGIPDPPAPGHPEGGPDAGPDLPTTPSQEQ